MIDVSTKTEQDVRYEALLESLGEGIVVLDKDGNVELVNRATEQLLGWKMDEIKGKKWYDVAPLIDERGDLIPPEHRSTKIVMESGKTRYNATYSYVRRDGTHFPVSTTAAPIWLNERVIGVIAVFRDITLEKQADRAKSEFVSLASHQLRTPLSAIKWFSEILLSGDAGELQPDQKEYIQNISQSNDRMIDLVNSLLNVSRIESGRIIIDPKPTDMGKLVNQVVKELEVKVVEKKLHMRVDVLPDLPLVSVDPKLIYQVWMNLLTNAIKYSQMEGDIVIIISLKDAEIVCQVSDNGYGIPEHEKSKIFQKFFRGTNVVKLETDGTGLGLYLAKAVVESSGGRIWFESAENKGTAFWFTLPLAGSPIHEGEVTLS